MDGAKSISSSCCKMLNMFEFLEALQDDEENLEGGGLFGAGLGGGAAEVLGAGVEPFSELEGSTDSFPFPEAV